MGVKRVSSLANLSQDLVRACDEAMELAMQTAQSS